MAEAADLVEKMEGAVATLLRLPAAGPEPPPGSGEVRLFRAAPRYLLYSLIRWGIKQSFALLGLGIGFGFVAALPPQLRFLEVFEFIGVAAFAAQLPVSFGAVWLDFNRRWYMVTDRALRIREGVWKLHERTMSYANVQNLEIRQGPLDRLLGLASLEVRSAGGGQAHKSSGGKGSGIGEDLHVASFRGVDNAEEIRDLILARLRSARGAGLGDPDEEREAMATAADGAMASSRSPAAPADGTVSPDALAAAHELLAEARALRAAIV